MSDVEQAIANLRPSERELLAACIRHERRQDARMKRSPRAIRRPFYAGGAKKRVARGLLEAQLLDPVSTCFEGTGADLYLSPLGRQVADELEPDLDVLHDLDAAIRAVSEGPCR